ncbi:MAG: peptide chain release factor 1 [Planctomycetota bacterium]|nr:MAG: peptide chain release factor 1 [Planctomycetota bacterium]REJ90531.1 MAG: peptide chain release factor 1 [Planctomycetota bacterium]REK24154.1 MAG: peptide chain release factor 1 [Planctomycetota bacterium]REK38394.1 MAG: peptide chain release factor 1 [Planctomycetota bacterium]
MFPSLETKLKRFEELERKLQDPEVLSDHNRLIDIQREYGGLKRVAEPVREFHKLEADIQAAREMVEEESDPDAEEYAQQELAQLLKRRAEMETELEELVAVGDSITRGGLIMEIRAGTGGDEAALFAGDLFGMYSRFIENRGWKMEVIDSNPTERGGFKEITFSVSGEGAFHELQFESGGHRVQRVPETETQGRIHTSAATVAVLPEASDVEVDINNEDLQIDTMRAGGPGGQKVNKTESAVRITHLPTGIVVKCQDEKSQHKNKAKAMRVLRGRLLEAKQREADAARAAKRRTLVGSGDRSERVRTYNFPQGRITDHRIGLTLYKLDQFMQGDLDEMIAGLLEFDRQERLRGDDDEQTDD